MLNHEFNCLIKSISRFQLFFLTRMDNLDPDFISFLYSERERENNLSQLQGWNNWALIGALVTVLCAAYAILKECVFVNWKDVLYYSGGTMAFFLNYNSWWRIFKRERGMDMSKVRMLKEVVPYVQIALVFVCSVLSLILIPILDEINFVFWMWLIMAVVYALALIVVVGHLRRVRFSGLLRT